MLNYDFLKVLFSDLNGGFIEVRAFHCSTKQPFQQFYCTIEEINVEQLSKDHDVYFGVCPRQVREGNKSAVKYVSALWADLDFKDYKGGREEAEARMNLFPFPPSIVVETGNGLHCYWRLREPIAVNDVPVERYLKAIIEYLGADPACAELARVMRLPGTINHKDLNNLKQIKVLTIEPQCQYNLSDFDQFLVPVENSVKINPPGWIAEALAKIKEGNRNATFTKIIGRFHDDGLVPSDIYAMLEPHAVKHSYDFNELQRQIDGICQRYPKESVVISAEFKSSPLLLSEFLKKEIPPVEYYVTDLVQKKGKGMISAAPNVGKSIFVQNLALDIATGRAFLYE